MREHEMVVFDALTAPEDSAAWKKPFSEKNASEQWILGRRCTCGEVRNMGC